ncbi:MAG: IS110 family transposase [Rhodobacteraceae bacterium]|nr:IS110 family transposase [Paracoccaceae bacterium]
MLFSQAVGNDPAAIVSLIGKIEALEAENTRTAIDMLGGAASLLCAMFAEAGLPLVHTPGLAVNRARQGIRGGERKSDPKDAVVIAELARTRPDLRAVEPPDPLDAEIRLLVSRRRELVTEQTRRRRACATCSPASFRRWAAHRPHHPHRPCVSQPL